MKEIFNTEIGLDIYCGSNEESITDEEYNEWNVAFQHSLIIFFNYKSLSMYDLVFVYIFILKSFYDTAT